MPLSSMLKGGAGGSASSCGVYETPGLLKKTGWRIMTKTALFKQSLCAKTWQLHGQSCLLGRTLVVVDEDLFFSHSALLRIVSLNWNDGQKMALVKTNSSLLQN